MTGKRLKSPADTQTRFWRSMDGLRCFGRYIPEPKLRSVEQAQRGCPYDSLIPAQPTRDPPATRHLRGPPASLRLHPCRQSLRSDASRPQAAA
jgi:hypothetical protein